MSATPPRAAVIDASAVVALLVDAGPAGMWAARQVNGSVLAVPELMLYEAASILRRHLLAGLIDQTAARLAHADLVALPVVTYPYGVVADRTWALRGNLTVYDACYVALAELLGAPLLTLDARLAGAPGPRCRIVAFQGSP